MARPLSTVATIAPKLRGSALYIHCLIRGLKVRHTTGIKIDAQFVGVNGYVKSSHPEHVDLNNRLQAIVDRYKLASDIAVGSNDVSEDRIKREYARLLQEDKFKEVLTVQANLKAQLQANTAHYWDERGKRDVRVRAAIKNAVRIPTPADRLQAAALDIDELEALLRVKKLERDNELRKQNQYGEDLLTVFALKYTTRKGLATMAEGSKRTYESFIRTLNDYSPHWKIQDVTEAALIDFQDWMIGRGNYNSTINNYIIKIKTVLNYYADRPALLPSHVIITKDYKNYTSELPPSPEHVVALSQDEIHQLLRFDNFKKKSWQKVRDMFVLCCATGCRVNDLLQIDPTMIKDGHIEFTPGKTKKKAISVSIPINPISAAILAKYDYNIAAVKLEDYYINSEIKLICQQIGGSFNKLEKVVYYVGNDKRESTPQRWEVIKSHCGRRTYSTLRSAEGVNLPELMLETGHTDAKTLLGYINKRAQRQGKAATTFALPGARA